MYSPKIRESLIPELYRLAKRRKVPMTVLVNGFVGYSLSIALECKKHKINRHVVWGG